MDTATFTRPCLGRPSPKSCHTPPGSASDAATFSRPCLGRPSPLQRHSPPGAVSDGSPHRAFDRVGLRHGLLGPAARPRRSPTVTEALAPSLTLPQGASIGTLQEDFSAGVVDRLRSGTVTAIGSPQELQEVLRASGSNVVVLKCKAKSCRPCMAFKKKYTRLAAELPGAIFLEVLGDYSPELRKLMMEFKVKATPTFRIYKKGEPVEHVVGINRAKLSRAVKAAMGIAGEDEDLAN